MSMSTVHHHHHHHTRATWGGGVDSPQRSERAEARRDRSDDTASQPGGDTTAPAPRGNPLVGALMKALQSLVATPAGGGSTGTAPAQAEVGAADPTTTTESAGPAGPGELREAAYAFANELFGALRGAGSEGDDDRGRHHGHGHNGHPGNHHGWHRGGRRDDDLGRFGGLIGRLEALARTLEPPSADTITPPTTPRAVSDGTAGATPILPAGGSSTATVPALPLTATSAPLAPSSALASNGRLGVSLTIALELDAGGMVAAPQAEQAAPLLAAFQQLMGQLSPAQAGTTGTPSDTTARLKTFLLDMAAALSAAGQGNASLKPPVGGIIDLSA